MTFSNVRRALHRLVTGFRPGRAETELAREIAAHLQLLEDELVASGMTREDARYAARRAFGGVEQAKEHQRDARSFRWLAGWPMDLRLGVRMLRRSPGLTVIGVAALAVAIGGGAAYLEFLNDLFRPALPLPQGDRIVAVLNWDSAKGDPEHRSLYEFAIWRDEVRSIEHLGAFVQFERNFITDDGLGEPVGGVEISAAAFRIAGTPPLLGRPLIDEDENADASPVAVIGYDLWQVRLAGDPAVIGRTIRLGRTPHTIVGVMPASFGFPLRDTLWVPLKLNPTDLRRADGPRTRIFGRLAPGVAIAAAQSELDTIGARVNADTPGTNQQLRPRVMPYVESLWASSNGRLQTMILYSVNIFFLGLLGLCGANVATLVFARTATRQGEITVRTALGASRGRIVAQLFAEALVLAAIAAVVGLFAARAGGQWATDTFKAAQEVGAMPFWWDEDLAPETILYAAVLTVLAAAVAGIVPALKATGPEMQGRLKEAAGGTTIRFGGVWTAVIVGQVAVTVIFLTSLVSLGWNLFANPTATQSFAFPVREFLTLVFATERQPAGANATYELFEARLSADPGIVGVTYTDSVPGRGSEFFVQLEGMPSGRTDDDPRGAERRWSRTTTLRRWVCPCSQAGLSAPPTPDSQWRSSTKRSCAGSSAAATRSGCACGSQRTARGPRRVPGIRSSASLATYLSVPNRLKPRRCTQQRRPQGHCACRYAQHRIPRRSHQLFGEQRSKRIRRCGWTM